MAESGDMKAHEATYRNILTLFRWSILAGIIVTFIVILLIS